MAAVMRYALGLGAAAVVIAILAFIWLARRQSDPEGMNNPPEGYEPSEGSVIPDAYVEALWRRLA